jgi:hypothetical protein
MWIPRLYYLICKDLHSFQGPANQYAQHSVRYRDSERNRDSAPALLHLRPLWQACTQRLGNQHAGAVRLDDHGGSRLGGDSIHHAERPRAGWDLCLGIHPGLGSALPLSDINLPASADFASKKISSAAGFFRAHFQFDKRLGKWPLIGRQERMVLSASLVGRPPIMDRRCAFLRRVLDTCSIRCRSAPAASPG